MSAMEMLWISIAFFLMRWRSRSSGPSKFSSLTGNASIADSKSWCSILILQPHCAPYAVHRFVRHCTRALAAVEHHLAQVRGPGERGAAAFTDRIEIRVDGLRQLHLHLDIAHFARAI